MWNLKQYNAIPSCVKRSNNKNGSSSELYTHYWCPVDNGTIFGYLYPDKIECVTSDLIRKTKKRIFTIVILWVILKTNIDNSKKALRDTEFVVLSRL